MYSRSETAQLRHEFWITFGKYIGLHPGSEGIRINWVNYHTGHKHLYFRMDAGKSSASISIQITHADPLQREMYWERFMSFRTMIHSGLEEEWIWEEAPQDEHGKVIAKIGLELKGVNVFDRNTWPEIISFLKPRMIALDAVWNEVKDGFEDLR